MVNQYGRLSVCICLLLYGSFCAAFEVSSVVGTTLSHYGVEVHRRVAQQLLINKLVTNSEVSLTETRSRSGSSTLSLRVNQTLVFRYSYALSRIRQFVPAQTLASEIVRRLREAGYTVTTLKNP